jgi:phage baseplate assembly protein gpV
VSTLVPALQALMRDELGAVRTIELGIVTDTFTNDGGGGDNNIAISTRIRGSALELQHVPVAVGRLGLSAAPRVGDLAVLAFVGGDVNGAVAIGFLYDEQTRAPDAKKTEIVYVVPDDQNDDDRRVELQLANGNKLTVKDGRIDITMGKTTLAIESDGAVTLESAGDMTFTSHGKLDLKADGDVSIVAGGAGKLESGTDLNVKAGSGATVEAGTTAELKGVTTSISGMTSFKSG